MMDDTNPFDTPPAMIDDTNPLDRRRPADHPEQPAAGAADQPTPVGPSPPQPR